MFIAFSFSRDITISQTDNDYFLKYTEGDSYRILNFRRNLEDSVYTYIHYSVSFKPKALSEEVCYIDTLWDIAGKTIDIKPSSVDIGYPLEYPDIMPAYIQAFLDSEEWQAHVSLNGKALDYNIMHDVIYGDDIFSDLIDLFYLHGYFTVGVSSEKHGFVLKEELQKYGFNGDEIIPMPYMLYWHIERVKKVK